MPELHIDDPERGVSAETSHPAFVAVAPVGYFDQGDHFAPFGNDSGYDALRELEQWYAEGGADEELPLFVDGLLGSWGFGVPHDTWLIGLAAVQDRLAEGVLDEVAVTAEAQAQLATVLGQFKIRGGITPAARIIATAVLDVKRALNAHARATHPDRTHADEDLVAIEVAAGVIQGAPEIA